MLGMPVGFGCDGMKTTGLVLYGICGLLALLGVVQVIATMSVMDLFRYRTIAPQDVTEWTRVQVAQNPHWRDEEGASAQVTFVIQSFDPLTLSLTGQVQVRLPHDLLLEFIHERRGGSQSCDGVVHYDPVFTEADGALSLAVREPAPQLILSLSEATGLRTFAEDRIVPLASPDRAKDPMTWVSAPMAFPLQGDAAAFPADRYRLPLRVSLRPAKGFAELRGCTYGFAIPMEIYAIRGPNLGQVRLRAGQSALYPHTRPEHLEIFEFELMNALATRLQAWSLLIGMGALCAGLVVHVVHNARLHPAQVGSDLAIMAAAALAIPPMKSLVPGPPTAIATRLDGAVMMIFILLIAAMIWRVARLLRDRD